MVKVTQSAIKRPVRKEAYPLKRRSGSGSGWVSSKDSGGMRKCATAKTIGLLSLFDYLWANFNRHPRPTKVFGFLHLRVLFSPEGVSLPSGCYWLQQAHRTLPLENKNRNPTLAPCPLTCVFVAAVLELYPWVLPSLLRVCVRVSSDLLGTPTPSTSN